MRNALVALALMAALAAAGPLLSGCGDGVDGTGSHAFSSSSSSSSSGGSSLTALTPDFGTVLPGGGTTPCERAATLGRFAAYGLQFTSTSARSRQTQPIIYSVDAGNGYTTTVTITPGTSTTIEYVLRKSGSTAALYTGSYTITVSTTGGYTYAGSAAWNVPATDGSTYSGTSTTNLTGSATTGAVNGTISATSGSATVDLTINADGAITGTAKYQGIETGTFSGSLTSGITYASG